MPSITQVHIDQPLTMLSVLYKNDVLIGDDVAPVVPVNKRSDKYFVYDPADFASTSGLSATNRSASLRAPGAEAREIDYTMSNKQFYAEEYALRKLVTHAERAYSDSPLSPDQDATIFLTERLRLDFEQMLASYVGTYANYKSGWKGTLTTGATGTSWAQYGSVNSKPFDNIKTAKLAVLAGILREPTTMLLSRDAALALSEHPHVRNEVIYTNKDALTQSGLPVIFRGLAVQEAAQQYNTADEGLAYSGGNLWRSDTGTNKALVVIYYRNSAPSIRSCGFVYQFEAPDDATGVRGFAVRRWEVEARKGYMVEVSCMRDRKGIGVDKTADTLISGYHFAGATD